MSKFASKKASPATPPAKRARGPVVTSGVRDVTHEGAAAWVRDPKSELFLLAVTNMVGEDTFYESGTERDARFAALIHQLTLTDPLFVSQLIPWLRNFANMRSAPLVAAAEYVNAGGPQAVPPEGQTKVSEGLPSRAVIDSACVRADEPAELLAYWLNTYGRPIPKPIKRGLSDACRRLYTERNVLKYDGKSRGVRYGDLIELCHPKPQDEARSDLFETCIARRHQRERLNLEKLPMLNMDAELMAMPEGMRRNAMQRAIENGWSWERLAGWLPKGGMDAEAWETVIPSMGYMALLRNLRNFEQANISPQTIAAVSARLADPERVANSRQFPFRFLSAWKATQSMTWGPPLETALNLSCGNIPVLKGRTLVLIDVSGSMAATISERSQVTRMEVGALFAGAVAKKSGGVDCVAFGTDHAKVSMSPNTSILRFMEAVGRANVGHATNLFQAMDAHYNAHDRVVCFTDGQVHPHHGSVADKVPAIYMFNLGGYRTTPMELGAGRHEFGGFSDATFRAIALLGQHTNVNWDELFALSAPEETEPADAAAAL